MRDTLESLTSQAVQEHRALPRDVAALLHAEERIAWVGRPSPWWTPLGSLAWLVFLLAGFGAAGLISWIAPNRSFEIVLITLVVTIVWLICREVIRLCRLYLLTDRRMVAAGGVFSRVFVEAPVVRMQSAAVLRTLLERLTNCGSVGLWTAAGGGPDVSWSWIADPEPVARLVRDAVAGRPLPTQSRGAEPLGFQPVDSASMPSANAIPILGLAGGIGAGKSEVARAFASLGCVVIDSDARAKAALDRPDVRDTLVEWWGSEILDEHGRVVRAKVAEIVFADPAQRTRLEQLIHPIVRQDRAQIIDEIAADDPPPPAAVIDAPLLFEAGLDAECDAVVFVDAPREERVARVVRARGWSEAELTRREAAQWPLSRKRDLCRFVVQNGVDQADLDDQARRILQTLGRLPA